MPTVLFSSEYQQYDQWRPALLNRLPDLDLRRWPDIGNPEDVDILLVWSPPLEALAFPNLKLVQCLGAGVDHLINLPIPEHVALARLIDRTQVAGFVEYVVGAVLTCHRDFPRYRQSQLLHAWEPRKRVQAADRKVGVMGLGEMGAPCAISLAEWGFNVKGWSRSSHQLEGVKTFSGEQELGAFLSDIDILICALPLTSTTEGILNRQLFEKLAPGAYVINVGRGGHCNEADLCAAIQAGQLSGALLDVTSIEPLPPTHALWDQPEITITPHMATSQIAASAAGIAAENITRVRQGMSPLGLVDRSRKY